jgi:N4-gp56 family major capsid protein
MSEPSNATVPADFDGSTILPIIAEETIYANAQKLVWDAFAMHRQAAADGSGAVFPLLSALALATTPLDADANPSASNLAGTGVTITTAEYGNPVELQKKLLRTSREQVLRDAIAVLAVNMAETRDSLAGAQAVGGSNVRFAAGAASAAALNAGDVLTRLEIVRAWAALETALAPRFADGTYYAGLHAYAVADLFSTGANTGDFVDVAKYAAPEAVRAGEIGRWQGFTFFTASQRTFASLAAGNEGAAGAFSADKLTSVFAGPGFLGYAVGAEPAVIPTFESNDRLRRFLNLGWYGDFAYGRVREANGYRIVSRSVIAPNP